MAGTLFAGTINEFPSTVSIETGIQAGELELQDLGFDPSVFFFFTGNTQYDYNGTYELEIIAAALNPAGATSLEGVTTKEAIFIIDDNGDVSDTMGIPATDVAAVPEPSAWLLLAAGLVLLLVYALPRGTKFRDAEFMQ